MKRVFLLSLLALALLGVVGTSIAQLPPGGTFTDDNGNTHEAFIEAIAAEGITTGCGPALFCPADDVTRSQMASFLARALELPPATRDWFPDDTGLVHEDNINRIADAGITTGFSDGTYHPAEPVRRDQMASFLARALDLPATTIDFFTDDTGLVHEDNINRVAEAEITLGCSEDGYCPSQNVRRDQMASFLGRALDLEPIVPPPPVGTLFSGPIESMPGLTGQLSFEVSAGNDEVKNPSLDLVLDGFQCDGVTLSGDGTSTLYTTVPVFGESFAYHGSTLTWTGTFDATTSATGTISGTMLLGTACDWGPLSWSAIDTGRTAPTTTTSTSTSTSTTSTSTTTTTLPSGDWPACDFDAFTVTGSGDAVAPLQIPGDDPAILDISYTGTDTFYVTTLDAGQAWIDFIVTDGGGGYAGVRPVNHNSIYEDVRYVEVEAESGQWTIDVRPVCTARTMSGDSITGAGDEVVIVNRSGSADLTHTGDNNFIVWSHQSYTDMDLEVNEIGPFTATVEIDAETVFLDVFTGLAPGPWTVSFP